MLTKHTPSIPKNLLEYVNNKLFVRHWISKVWKYYSLRENKNTLLA
jgi:hypothetical protein